MGQGLQTIQLTQTDNKKLPAGVSKCIQEQVYVNFGAPLNCLLKSVLAGAPVQRETLRTPEDRQHRKTRAARLNLVTQACTAPRETAFTFSVQMHSSH
jgi:hypothetical protein